jgi:hypothetical protein
MPEIDGKEKPLFGRASGVPSPNGGNVWVTVCSGNHKPVR